MRSHVETRFEAGAQVGSDEVKFEVGQVVFDPDTRRAWTCAHVLPHRGKNGTAHLVAKHRDFSVKATTRSAEIPEKWLILTHDDLVLYAEAIAEEDAK